MADFISTLSDEQRCLFNNFQQGLIQQLQQDMQQQIQKELQQILQPQPQAQPPKPQQKQPQKPKQKPQQKQNKPQQKEPDMSSDDGSSSDGSSSDDDSDGSSDEEEEDDDQTVCSDMENSTITEQNIVKLLDVANRTPVWKQMGYASYKEDPDEHLKYLKERRVAKAALAEPPHPFKVSMRWSSVKSKATRTFLINKVREALKPKEYSESVALSIILSLTHNRRRNRNRVKNFHIKENNGVVKKGRPQTHGRYVGRRRKAPATAAPVAAPVTAPVAAPVAAPVVAAAPARPVIPARPVPAASAAAPVMSGARLAPTTVAARLAAAVAAPVVPAPVVPAPVVPVALAPVPRVNHAAASIAPSAPPATNVTTAPPPAQPLPASVASTTVPPSTEEPVLMQAPVKKRRGRPPGPDAAAKKESAAAKKEAAAAKRKAAAEEKKAAKEAAGKGKKTTKSTAVNVDSTQNSQQASPWDSMPGGTNEASGFTPDPDIDPRDRYYVVKDGAALSFSKLWPYDKFREQWNNQDCWYQFPRGPKNLIDDPDKYSRFVAMTFDGQVPNMWVHTDDDFMEEEEEEAQPMFSQFEDLSSQYQASRSSRLLGDYSQPPNPTIPSVPYPKVDMPSNPPSQRIMPWSSYRKPPPFKLSLVEEQPESSFDPTPPTASMIGERRQRAHPVSLQTRIAMLKAQGGVAGYGFPVDPSLRGSSTQGFQRVPSNLGAARHTAADSQSPPPGQRMPSTITQFEEAFAPLPSRRLNADANANAAPAASMPAPFVPLMPQTAFANNALPSSVPPVQNTVRQSTPSMQIRATEIQVPATVRRSGRAKRKSLDNYATLEEVTEEKRRKKLEQAERRKALRDAKKNGVATSSKAA